MVSYFYYQQFILAGISCFQTLVCSRGNDIDGSLVSLLVITVFDRMSNVLFCNIFYNTFVLCLCLTALQILKCDCSRELCRVFLSTGCPVFDAFFRGTGNSHFFTGKNYINISSLLLVLGLGRLCENPIVRQSIVSAKTIGRCNSTPIVSEGRSCEGMTARLSSPSCCSQCSIPHRAQSPTEQCSDNAA